MNIIDPDLYVYKYENKQKYSNQLYNQNILIIIINIQDIIIVLIQWSNVIEQQDIVLMMEHVIKD